MAQLARPVLRQRPWNVDLAPLRCLSAGTSVCAQAKAKTLAFVPVQYADTPDGHTDEAALTSIIEGLTGSSDGVKFSIVTGGITNKLFKVAFPPSAGTTHGHAAMTVRVFGGEGMIDRDLENETFIAMADAGVGKDYIGGFKNGRVESWISNADALTLDQMAHPDVYTKVAAELAKLHQVRMPGRLAEQYGEPSLWRELWAWLDQAQAGVNTIGDAWGADAAER